VVIIIFIDGSANASWRPSTRDLIEELPKSSISLIFLEKLNNNPRRLKLLIAMVFNSSEIHELARLDAGATTRIESPPLTFSQTYHDLKI